MDRPQIILAIFAAVDKSDPMIAYPTLSTNLEKAFLADAAISQKYPYPDARRDLSIVRLADPFAALTGHLGFPVRGLFGVLAFTLFPGRPTTALGWRL